MVQAAGDVHSVFGRARPPRPGGGARRAGGQGRGLVHAREDRIVWRAEAMPGRGRACPGNSRVLHGCDVAGVVHELELSIGSRLGHDDADSLRVQHPECSGELDSQLDPDRRERVPRTEVVTNQPIIPGEMQGAGHLALHVVVPSVTRSVASWLSSRARAPARTSVPLRGCQDTGANVSASPGRLRSASSPGTSPATIPATAPPSGAGTTVTGAMTGSQPRALASRMIRATPSPAPARPPTSPIMADSQTT